MPNANLPEVLRFVFGLLGCLFTAGCIPATIHDYQRLRAAYPLERERLIVAISWIRAAVFRMLTACLLAGSGWLLMLLPEGPYENSPERLAISWGWVLCAIYVDVQALWARWDRHRIRRIQREEVTS